MSKNKSFGQIMLRGVKSFQDDPGKILRLSSPNGWQKWIGATNFSGQSVTVPSALQLSTVWSIVNLLAGTMSTLPIFLNRTLPDGSKVPARDHSLFDILKYRPNADMTAVIFWQIYWLSMLLWGAAYVEIKRGTGGKITSLDFLYPEAVTWRRLNNGSIEWSYVDPVARATRTLSASQMWFTPAYTLDGINPLSPIRMGANVIGGGIAADRAAADTFTRGMKVAGMVTTTSILKPGQRDDVRNHVATVNAEGGVMVMESGSNFHALQMNPQDAQLLETRQFSVGQICSWWGVNPTMIGQGSDKNSNWGTGLTQQKQGFVDFCLRQWAVKVEASIREGLLTPVERLTLSAEWVFEGLLRGNPKERAEFYQIMERNGNLTSDEVRALENWPKMGGNAAVLRVEGNMMPLDKLGEASNNSTTAANAVKSWLGLEEKHDDPAP